MKVTQRKKEQTDFFEMLPQGIATLKKNIIDPFFGEDSNGKYANERPPLRAEIYTVDQMELHAKALAKRHVLVTSNKSEQLLKRLSENENILLEVHAQLTATLRENINIVPAGEWLLDNFYMLEEQIYTGKKHLPKGYSKGLPQLLKGSSAGLPRVYDIAVEIISHSDGHVNLRNLTDFVTAYQSVTALKIGELWAIPIMLRLALIENLRRLSIQISIDLTNKSLANDWADKMIETAEKDPKNLVLIIADMARSEPPLVSSFVAELTRRLQEKGNSLSLPLNWIEQRLSENGFTSSELVQQENQAQATAQVSISNSISSLRFLSTTDWRDFVESTSIVEATLRRDINDVYSHMDFHTRDHYRHVVERVAKKSLLSEQEVAELVVETAKKNSVEQKDPRMAHVGYYLAGKGIEIIQKKSKQKSSFKESCSGFVNRFPLTAYLGSILILTAFICWGLIEKARMEQLDKGIMIFLYVITLMATSRLAVSIINWLSTILTSPSLLPRMDFSKGIPDEYRTMVVIPTMITSASTVDDLVEGLEVRFLANRDVNLYFALLTDVKDAATETLEEDEILLNYAKAKVIALNKKYKRASNDTFFLFHRPRKWNAKDKIWMGYERKRGKLADLNALLRGHQDSSFSVIVGDENIYQEVKYIITLDTDTQLPRETAWKMTGTMAHPLNHPLYNQKKRRVTEGYSILQPRVSNSLPGADSSLYARIHGNEPGTDPYTKATSDVYQDLFMEGSFIGKGIYDIDEFERTLGGKFPDNRILSHDLLEGCYSRSGLMTDVQLYEDYPIRYSTDMQRRHRWIRGDWQIARWIFPFVPGTDKKNHRNPLSLFSKWKIFDNIRRSLVPLSLLLLFLFGWTISSTPWFWTLTVTLIIILPSVVNFIWELSRKPADVIFSQHLVFTSRAARDQLFQYFIELACLPYEVFSNTDAILRTYWRMFISGKHLLQWNLFTNSYRQKTIAQSYADMWFSPFLALAVFGYLTWYSPLSLIVAMPVLILWAIAPAIVWWISRPFTKINTSLALNEKKYLRMLARKIWLFFETFVTAEENWLPPDNYQEQPVERTAHRTSPTNIGLALLANLNAHEFGYINITQLLERCGNTLNTMKRMERYQGHLYNWYDTISLVPLAPKYISTVDSGNLVGHLITLKQGLLNIPDKKIITGNNFLGLSDAVNLLSEKLTGTDGLSEFTQDLENGYPGKLDDAIELKVFIDLLEASFTRFMTGIDTDLDEEQELWAQKIITHIEEMKNNIIALMPWLLLPEIPVKFKDLIPDLPAIPTIRELSKIEQLLLQKIIGFYHPDNSPAENEWLINFQAAITRAGHKAKEIILTSEQHVVKCIELANIDYDFLYDRAQHLLSIGYNVDEQRRDNSYYDLLASEARLTTFVAIAQGKLPQESWFALGRQLTNLGTTPILLSWSGSMFEYLMPLLVMPSYENTLLDQTNKAVIQKQIDYGKKRGIPWGISESGYNMLDANLNYQYRAFGVPGLGFKRGLGEDLVISPYSTIMSLMVAPGAAYQNLRLMKETGFEGKYGFYEAIDYTSSRLGRRQTYSLVQSFMAHHQGMSFLSVSYLLLNKPMQRLFESEVQIKSTLLLLQERIPRVTTFYSPSVHAADVSVHAGNDVNMRVIDSPHTTIPEVQLLSNGRYHVMVTNSGGGYSRWKNISVTRWREDVTCDNWGTFCFIHDLDNDKYWSSAYQPALKSGDSYEAVFSQGRAEFRRRDFSLETHTEIVVSPEDDIELRRVHITNRSRKKRTIEITSYAEPVLASAASDEAHPAFSNLFVQTEINEQRHAILATRRPRSVDEHAPWMFHLMKVHDAEISGISYETNREQFIGRGNFISDPKVLKQAGVLSNTSGSVLDPIASIRYRIVLEPYQSATIDMIFGMAETRDTCDGLIEKYQERYFTNRVLELSWTHSQVILRQINAVEADAQLYARMAGSIIFPNAALRTDATVISRNQRGQSGLWGYSISGDLPIVLLQIEDPANIDLVRQLVQAHNYWHLKGLDVDLVIWNEDHGGYRMDLQNQIMGLIAPVMAADVRENQGRIFIRAADQISNEDRILFQTVAHIIISDKLGTLDEQISRRSMLKVSIPAFDPTSFHASVETPVFTRNDLQFYNGIGGFTSDGKEYIITTGIGKRTPAPWVNVLANPSFGAIISESGQGYTWIENAHEMRLTPWNNDPVSDLKGEAFYLRDEESGRFWSPSPLPCTGKSSYTTRHGFGYSVFEYVEDGIGSEMWVYTDIEAPVKFIVLKVNNHSSRTRKISATGYVEWILGDVRSKSVMHIITETDKSSGAILARNAYNHEFDPRVAFFDADDQGKNITTDRTEFIGRNGSLSNPEAMNKIRLSGKTGAALDPCAAIQVSFELSEGETRQVVFRLGAGKDRNDAESVIKRFEGNAAAEEALKKIHNYWRNALNAVWIETPDAALNILTNGWLNYQTLACRIWARSGFYQSGGAFGFRDQLQDVLSLLHTKPQLVREQILLCASRQFNEGDVQHWWHPPVGRGVRTTCSDDFLWLPFVTARYVANTGDTGILDERVHFLESRLLNAGEESNYDLPVISDQASALYDHCLKSITHALKFGEHGLPFMGSGDWNDGMDKVGQHGKGESVWLAFFLYDILLKFKDVAIIKNDKAFAEKCTAEAEQLRKNINEHAWDGNWYRRAYFDDGTPLGSNTNDECKIDSIAQSWSVLSKAGDKDLSLTAMRSADKKLVRKEDGIIQLFDPPFDKSALNPGYIKGYVPGVRENGGQYTHAAVWLIMAFAAIGDKEKTWELLQMINPLNLGGDEVKIAKYKSEPYVIAADVYAESLHKGRGGWTWYTGSAGWMYQLIIESFIGLQRKADTLSFSPCLPPDWKTMKINYRYLDTNYHIQIEQNGNQPNTTAKMIMDNVEQKENIIQLKNDGGMHEVKLLL